MEKIKKQPVVFYDGECGFCSWSVQLILKNRRSKIYFMPLQNEKAKSIIEEAGEYVQMDTIFYLDNNQLYSRWSAVLRITKNMSLSYKIIGFLGHLIPKFVGDWIYDKIAKRRKKIKGESCLLPLPHERELFLH